MEASVSGGSGDSPPEVLAFNLTDPERLTSQLDAACLDEEETELLLDEALKLNARLKKVLRQQQLEEPPSGPPPGSKPPRGQGQGRGKGHGPTGRGAHPLEEQFARKQPTQMVGGGKTRLPPIGSSTSGAGAGGAGEGTRLKNGKGSKPSDSTGVPRPSSSRRRQGSAKKTGRQVDNRPAWDDRFSFD